MAEVKSHHALFALLIFACIIVYICRVPLIEIFERWRNRNRWQRLPTEGPGSSPQESGFHEDLEAGLSSDTFDINSNIRDSDPRKLDETAREEIHRLMEAHGVSFDEARLRYFRDRLSENDIGTDGVPRDAKTVTF